MTASDTADISTRGFAAYVAFFRAMASACAEGATSTAAGIEFFYSGDSLPTHNAAILTAVPSEPAAVLVEVHRFFERRGRGRTWSLSAEGPAADTMRPVCRAAAMWGDRMEGMALDPLRGHEPAIAGLTLRRVESAADLRRFDQVMVAAFGGPWAAPDLLETRGLLDAPAMTHYLGIYNGRPVATATRLLCEGLAGVFNVGVVPEVRGRGIGTAITWRAALEGRDEGATASFLQASRMGAPIYRRMGYQTVSSYTIWFGPPLSLRGG